MKYPSLLPIILICGVVVAVAGWLVWAPDFLPRATPASLTVITTISPLTDITQNIGGEHVNVIQLIPPGVTEHSSALTPQQLAQAQNADVLLMIGQQLDNRLAEQVSNSVTVPLVPVDQGIRLREFAGDHEHAEEAGAAEGETHEAGSVDPHYWLTVPNAKIITQNIADTLIELDPDHATDYQLQTTNYLQELDELEATLLSIAATAPQKNFIAMHDAWSYLADHYGFSLVGTYEPVEGQEPSIADLQHLQELVREYSLTAFYSEPQKETTAAVQFIRTELGLEISVLDPVGGIPPRDSYIELMRANIHALVQPS